MSVIRLSGTDTDRIIALADVILNKWREYTDEEAFIYAYTDNEPHNTITPTVSYTHLDVYKRQAKVTVTDVWKEADIVQINTVLPDSPLVARRARRQGKQVVDVYKRQVSWYCAAEK